MVLIDFQENHFHLGFQNDMLKMWGLKMDVFEYVKVRSFLWK